MVESHLLGACGLYCGACNHYRASFPEGEHLLDEAKHQGKPAAGFTCKGCRSDALYIHPGCAHCTIRACTDHRGIPHCGLCPESPCERLEAFRDDGHVHHLDILTLLEELRKQGPGRWLAEQEKRWQCRCGASFSWYEESCHRCGAPLGSYGRRGDRSASIVLSDG